MSRIIDNTSCVQIDRRSFDSIPDTIAAFKSGQIIIVLDDPTRENEGDLIVAAAGVTTGQMGFLVRHTSGYVCAPLAATICDRLKLPPMVPEAMSQDPRRTAYTVSVDSADASVSTGISAHDRALTCRALANSHAKPADFSRPGHVLPLRARAGGVHERRGHTEAAVEFCRLAGLPEAAVIGELVDDGVAVTGKAEYEGCGMLRGEGCLEFARKWGLKICTISDLVEYLDEVDGKHGGG